MTDLLQGFDMIAAISEGAMNTQAYAVFTGTNKDGSPIIDRNLDITLDDTGIEIKGTIGSSDGGGPWYGFGVPGNQRAAYFYLPIQSGTMSYWKIEGGKPVKENVQFTDLLWAFKVNLDFVGMQQAAIQAGTKVPPVVQQHLSQFSDDLFTIRALMTDFENSNITDYDPDKSKIPDSMKTTQGISALGSALTAYFKGLKGSDNPYILGYAVDNKSATSNAGARPTFVPTGSTFSSFLDSSNSDLDALNFLLMTGGAEPPGGGAGQFTTNWITSTTVDGKFVIGQHLVFEGWLLPTIQNALSVGSPTRSGSGWKMTSTTDTRHTYSDAIGCPPFGDVDLHVHTTGNKTVNVSYSNPNANEARITITGTLNRRLDNSFQCALVETSWASVSQPFTITVTITGGTNGQFNFAYNEDIPSPSTDQGKNWVASMDSFFGGMKGFISGEISSLKGQLKSIAQSLESSLETLNARFVMPGGAVFFFKNPQFNAEGDLLADITYKTN